MHGRSSVDSCTVITEVPDQGNRIGGDGSETDIKRSASFGEAADEGNIRTRDDLDRHLGGVKTTLFFDGDHIGGGGIRSGTGKGGCRITNACGWKPGEAGAAATAHGGEVDGVALADHGGIHRGHRIYLRNDLHQHRVGVRTGIIECSEVEPGILGWLDGDRGFIIIPDDHGIRSPIKDHILLITRRDIVGPVHQTIELQDRICFTEDNIRACIYDRGRTNGHDH